MQILRQPIKGEISVLHCLRKTDTRKSLEAAESSTACISNATQTGTACPANAAGASTASAANAAKTGTANAANAAETGAVSAANTAQTGTASAANAAKTGTANAANAAETGAVSAANTAQTGTASAANAAETGTASTASTVSTAKYRRNGSINSKNSGIKGCRDIRGAVCALRLRRDSARLIRQPDRRGSKPYPRYGNSIAGELQAVFRFFEIRF